MSHQCKTRALQRLYARLSAQAWSALGETAIAQIFLMSYIDSDDYITWRFNEFGEPGASPQITNSQERFHLVFRPGRSDDGIDQLLISGLGHLHIGHLLRLLLRLRLLLLLLLARTTATSMRSTRRRRCIAGLPIQPSRRSAAAAAITIVGRLGHEPFHSFLFSRVLRLAVLHVLRIPQN